MAKISSIITKVLLHCRGTFVFHLSITEAEHEPAGIVVVGITQIRPVVEVGVAVVGLEVERIVSVLLKYCRSPPVSTGKILLPTLYFIWTQDGH